ncbi:SRPBCC domain-containing protein [Streptomyces synnematoformans]|uniref:SRPBCC domain-containing protein n=1 Tax=Streptomyces synnematoformans TaxID=415721 RepID=A0ABN2Y6K8_9ACTN
MYVPKPAETVRRVLSDAARLARNVPGVTLDAGAEGAAVEPGTLRGRLRLRVAGSSITYRGTLRLTPRGDSVAVEAEGEESRGSGSVTASLTLTPRDAAEPGTTALVCAGTVASTGRLAAVEPAQAGAAGARLLERFAESLAADLEAEPPAEAAGRPAKGPVEIGEPSGPGGTAAQNGARGRGTPDAADAADTEGPAAGAAAADEDAVAGDAVAGDAVAEPHGPDVGLGDDNERAIPGIPAPEQSGETPAGTGKVFDAEVPPPSLDPLADEVLDDLADAEEEAEAEAAADEQVDDLLEEPEAAHARRTMIGRSAEEVDHAPPRGRYAPTPAADAPVPTAGLRWMLPAAARAVGTPVIVGRVLRRRR